MTWHADKFGDFFNPKHIRTNHSKIIPENALYLLCLSGCH